MSALIRTVTLALALSATAFAAGAQEAAPEPTEGQAAGSDLSMGSTAEPAVGQLYVAGEFGDWDLRCVKSEEGNDPCQLYQLLVDAEGNSVAEVSLFNIPDGGPAVAGATIITPLETLLTEQLRLGIDAAETKQYPFSFCSQVGCFSRIGLTEAEVEALRRGVEATVTIVPAAAPGQRVELKMSLAGFTAGFQAVIDSNTAAQ
ncbi:invasion associated locus B family protein [Palleronia sp. KMU-117]|uniref:invasion associated locus B family protein n=1 Tax=Palleronia sp. KMU-117 TaxID=3434108 RepID=UPI003D73C10F